MESIGDHGDGRKRTPHVLVLAHPARGHLPAAFHVSMEVARRGILVTFVAFDAETSSLTSKHEAELRSLDLLRFHRLPRHELDPNSPNYTMNEDNLQPSLTESKLIEKLFASAEPPTCMMVSMFYWWAKELALDLKIPRYTILGSGAVFARFTQAVGDLIAQGQLRVKDDDKKLEVFDGQINIAGVPGLAFTDIPDIVRFNPTFYLKFAQTIVLEADGVLMNTFYQLEAEAMDALRTFATRNGQKFYAIGPLAPSIVNDAAADKSKTSDEDCFRWLDSQPTSSVVYVCFGSKSPLKPNQTEALGLGLEKSKYRFLLVLPESGKPQGDNDADFLPPNFDKRVTGYGYVLRGWAPQVKILSHPSVGAFFTHCGWNSCLEAIGRAMPLIGFPITADQQLNCRYIVDTLQIGIEVIWTPGDVPDQNAIEGAILLMMEEERRRSMQGRVKALQTAMVAALRADGSVTRERDELARDIKLL